MCLHRQLLEGATADELRGTHSMLQAALREAPGHAPADALPVLEASLLALETASGRALASQVCVYSPHFGADNGTLPDAELRLWYRVPVEGCLACC